MTFPHGNTPQAKYERIGIRARAIIEGAPWAEESDANDINEDEVAEIEAARKLAEQWRR